MVDDGRLKDVAERDPVEELEHRLERGLDETRLVRAFEHLDAEAEDLGELLALCIRVSVSNLQWSRMGRGRTI